VNADPKEIVWTSGATESDNLAIKGVAHFYGKKGKHIVTSKTEHKAVLDTCRHLERDGFEVTYLDPEPSGLIDLGKLEAALRDDTILVSIMHVNNEIGVIQDIEAIGELTRSRKILLHVDAAQSAGKVPIDLEQLKVDLMSFSAHKIYGPKGIGALYVRRKPRVRLEAQMHGGGHERGMRSGTLATHQIVGMGEAFRIAAEDMAAENERVLGLRNRLWDGIKEMEEVYLNGDKDQRVAGNLNVSFAYVEGESLIMALKDLAVSSGSACTSASLEPSYVLRALGREDELAHSSLRFTLGRFTTVEEVDYAIQKIHTEVGRLRELSPLWEMFKDGIDLKTIQWAAH
jgi:cysteine desulfurase